MIPREEKIKLLKNENSNGHLPGGCRPKNNRNALEQKAGFTVVSRQCRNPVTQPYYYYYTFMAQIDGSADSAFFISLYY